MIDLNLMGLLYCTHAALPHLVAAAEDDLRGVSDLVNVSSIGGRSYRPGSQVYNATKWGVGALSESMRQELAGKHVRVSVIEPGATPASSRYPGTSLPSTNPGPYCPRTTCFGPGVCIDFSTFSFSLRTESAVKSIGGSIGVLTSLTLSR